MAFRVENINELPPAIRAQAEKQLQAHKKPKRQHQKKVLPPEFESEFERDVYYHEIYPLLQTGKITSCEMHREFELFPKMEYCGLKLPAAKYTTDFFVTYQSGYKEAIEVKNKIIRKLQKDYIYRRRLFIEFHAKPNGWGFREVIAENREEYGLSRLGIKVKK